MVDTGKHFRFNFISLANGDEQPKEAQNLRRAVTMMVTIWRGRAIVPATTWKRSGPVTTSKVMRC
jgi:hypothetical protein